MILGLNWLKQNNVKMYFDLKRLRINGKAYVNLEEDMHVASTVRMKYTCSIKRNIACICYGKVRENPDLTSGQSYDISETDRGFIANEPGLKVINTVLCFSKNRTVPLLVVNETNRRFKLYRHSLMARIAPINETKIVDATSIIKNSTTERYNLQDLDVPSE